MILRLSILVIYTTIITLTTPPTEITYGLEKTFGFLKRFKVPVNKMALSNPDISFTLINNDKVLLKTDGSGNLLKCIKNIFGINVAKKMLEEAFIITEEQTEAEPLIYKIIE